jgi:rubrerythrin
VTTFEVFKTAERIENVAAAIYAFFAKQFADDPDLRALFVRLETEEQQHASRVRLLASRYRSDSKLLANVPGGPELDACLAQAEAALAEVQAGAWGRELAGIKERLARLEAQMAGAHAQAIAKDGHPALRDFFRQLALQDEAHLALLGVK